MSTDPHVRRSGSDYAEVFAAGLPTGLAWPRDPDSLLMQVVEGLMANWGRVDGRIDDLLVTESDPRATFEMLGDWETAFGLPDPCVQTTRTIEDRRLALVQKITSQGGQSRAFFIAQAAALGYTISIYEYAPYTSAISQCGDTRPDGALQITYAQCGLMQAGFDTICTIVRTDGDEWQCELGAPETRYYWKVKVFGTRLTWLRAGTGTLGQDHECEIAIADDLECMLRRLRPGHTELIFDYGYIDMTGAGSLDGSRAKTSAIPFFFLF